MLVSCYGLGLGVLTCHGGQSGADPSWHRGRMQDTGIDPIWPGPVHCAATAGVARQSGQAGYTRKLAKDPHGQGTLSWVDGIGLHTSREQHPGVLLLARAKAEAGVGIPAQ